jgi:hypothetical protein
MNVIFVGNQNIFDFFCGGTHVIRPHGSLLARISLPWNRGIGVYG